MIVNNAEVAYITFDATNSNKIDWFDMSRVLDSSYTDLPNTNYGRYFSVTGCLYSSIYYIICCDNSLNDVYTCTSLVVTDHFS